MNRILFSIKKARLIIFKQALIGKMPVCTSLVIKESRSVVFIISSEYEIHGDNLFVFE